MEVIMPVENLPTVMIMSWESSHKMFNWFRVLPTSKIVGWQPLSLSVENKSQLRKGSYHFKNFLTKLLSCFGVMVTVEKTSWETIRQRIYKPKILSYKDLLKKESGLKLDFLA